MSIPFRKNFENLLELIFFGYMQPSLTVILRSGLRPPGLRPHFALPYSEPTAFIAK